MSKEPTVEELIALATQPKKPSKKESSPEEFIKIFDIGPGEYKCRRKFLYDLYTKWAQLPKNYSAFNEACKGLLEEINNGKNIYFLINKSDSDLIKIGLYATEKK